MTQLINLLEAFDPELPLANAKTLPKEWYTDDEIAMLERKGIFEDTWHYVGSTEQLREPGSFLTALIGAEPIVVSRDKDGELNAFANVCRHKATAVESRACGKASFFQCRYHGWTYDLRGNLKGTPEFGEVLNFNKADNRLPAYVVDSCGPFVFVHLGNKPQKLESFLADFAKRMDLEALQRLQWSRRTEYDLECNWKVFVDNYLDGGYHVNTIHPALAGSLNYAEYKIETFEKSCLQFSPLKSDSARGSVSSVRKGDAAYYWWLMPNFMVNCYDGVMDTNLVLPLAPNRCRVIFDYYFSQTEGDVARSFIDESVKVAHQVQLEDQAVCESVQRGLVSRTYDTGRFSVKREAGMYEFHKMVSMGVWKAFRTEGSV